MSTNLSVEDIAKILQPVSEQVIEKWLEDFKSESDLPMDNPEVQHRIRLASAAFSAGFASGASFIHDHPDVLT